MKNDILLPIDIAQKLRDFSSLRVQLSGAPVTQEKLAKALSISVRTLASWLSGAKRPSFLEAVALQWLLADPALLASLFDEPLSVKPAPWPLLAVDHTAGYYPSRQVLAVPAVALSVAESISPGAGQFDWSEYSVVQDIDPSCWGEGSSAAADLARARLGRAIEETFPGVRVSDGLASSVSGPDDDLSREIEEWIASNWHRFLEAV